MVTTKKSATKPIGRPFKPGQGGRIEGVRNRHTELLEQLMNGEGEAIAKKLVGLAIGGDLAAIRIVVDRIAPARRGRPITLKLPPIRDAASISSALAKVVSATATGQISPEEASTLASVLETARRAIETEQLAFEVEELRGLLAEERAARQDMLNKES